MSKKRNAPKERFMPVTKKMEIAASEALLSLADVENDGIDAQQNVHSICDVSQEGSGGHQVGLLQPIQDVSAEHSYSSQGGNIRHTDGPLATMTATPQTLTKGTQTTFACSEGLSYKIDALVKKREETKQEDSKTANLLNFCYDTVAQDGKKFFFYTGLTVSQFEHLFAFLDDEVGNLSYWRGSKTKVKARRKLQSQTKCKL